MRRAELAEVGLGNEIGARGEHLRHFHEGGAQPDDRGDELVGAPRVIGVSALNGRPPPYPPVAVAEEGHREGAERKQNAERVHGGKLAHAPGAH